MTKAEEFDKATKLAMKGDLSLYDEDRTLRLQINESAGTSQQRNE